MCVSNGTKPTLPKNPRTLRKQKVYSSLIRAEPWRVRDVKNSGGQRAVEMDQRLQFVPNNVGSKGSEGWKWTKFYDSCIRAEQWGGQSGRRGRNGSNSPIRAEQWGGLRARGVEMDQILQFVLNNGGG